MMNQPGEPLNVKSLDIETPINVPLSAKYKRSFAYATVKDRLPVIISKVVDHLYREKLKIVKDYGELAREEIKTIIGVFSRLRNELQTNKLIVPLTSNGPDKDLWNSCLDDIAKIQQPRWFESPWLLVECYMYRRIREAFEKSSALQTFDPFGQQKRAAFASSLPAMNALRSYLNDVIRSEQEAAFDVKKELFKLLKVSLWGNKCDLSISAGEENDQKLDPIAQLNSLESNILVNDSEKVWEILNEVGATKKIDLVLDNAGFELFTDLCLADFLVSHKLAATVQLHAKAMPWFVSDVTPPDLKWTLEQLKTGMPELAARWQQHFDEGRWKLYPKEKSYFWTLPYDYNSIQKVDPELFSELDNSSLVIFKGDLNYRKLVGDCNLLPEALFSSVVEGAPTPLLALRTLKADVVVGLQPGQAQQIAKAHQDWMVSGEFAVIQLASK